MEHWFYLELQSCNTKDWPDDVSIALCSNVRLSCSVQHKVIILYTQFQRNKQNLLQKKVELHIHVLYTLTLCSQHK